MIESKALKKFWKDYARLPKEIQEKAKKQYLLFQSDTQHPGLSFKKIKDDIWSVRIDDDYRALGRLKGNLIFWFYIGPHKGYERELRLLSIVL